MALNLLAAAVDEGTVELGACLVTPPHAYHTHTHTPHRTHHRTPGPIEILELSKYWSEKKSDEKPQSRHQKKEALRVREDYLGATYGWNALERVDPNFTGGATPPLQYY
jgi:hypothetical protein